MEFVFVCLLIGIKSKHRIVRVMKKNFLIIIYDNRDILIVIAWTWFIGFIDTSPDYDLCKFSYDVDMFSIPIDYTIYYFRYYSSSGLNNIIARVID